VLGADASAKAALQYSLSDGLGELREWIAAYMTRLGAPCTPANILVTNGSQQGLEFLGRLMLSPGDPALVTWPTYLGALQAFNAYEPEYVRLDPRANAGRPELPAGADRAKFAYVVPDFANPSGATLTLEERERVLAIADSVGAIVIEDAAYSELRYEGERVPPLLALDAARAGGVDECRTVYCGTFSKTLSPGLRVGWIAAAAPLIQKLVLVKQASDLHSAPLNQMAVARVAKAEFDAQVARIRPA
ncbi:MAG: PLP-dependent aminotransferase family protein, partial [Alphaproteobacteria bacterium]